MINLHPVNMMFCASHVSYNKFKLTANIFPPNDFQSKETLPIFHRIAANSRANDMLVWVLDENCEREAEKMISAKERTFVSELIIIEVKVVLN